MQAIQLNCNLKMNDRVAFVCGRLAQRLHFLHRLRLFGVCRAVVWLFIQLLYYHIRNGSVV